MTTSNGAEISALIRQLFVTTQAKLDQQLTAESGVTSHQAALLTLIGQRPGLIQKDIVDVMQRRAATVSVFLKKLETAGLIKREIPADNSRNKNIYLTAAGAAIVKSFQEVRETTYQQLVAPLTSEQQLTLQQLLQKMV